MLQPDHAFEAYLSALVQRGHSRDWIRRNLPAVEQAYRDSPVPFEAPPEPRQKARDRYEEL